MARSQSSIGYTMRHHADPRTHQPASRTPTSPFRKGMEPNDGRGPRRIPGTAARFFPFENFFLDIPPWLESGVGVRRRERGCKASVVVLPKPGPPVFRDKLQDGCPRRGGGRKVPGERRPVNGKTAIDTRSGTADYAAPTRATARNSHGENRHGSRMARARYRPRGKPWISRTEAHQAGTTRATRRASWRGLHPIPGNVRALTTRPAALIGNTIPSGAPQQPRHPEGTPPVRACKENPREIRIFSSML